jgi:hypothetical protein
MTQPSSSRVRRAPDNPTSGLSRPALARWVAAAPSLLAIVACLLVGAASMSQRADRTQSHYRLAADAALAGQDFRTARVCYERLLQSNPHDNALLFGLARSLNGLGQAVESSQILQRIAPLQGPPGYAPAHVMMAEQLLFGPHDPKSLAAAEAHLRRALASDPANANARSLLASLYANTGRPVPPGL